MTLNSVNSPWRSLSWKVTCEEVTESERTLMGRRGEKPKPDAQVGHPRRIPEDAELCETCTDDRLFLLLTTLENLKGSRHQLPVWAVPTESTGPHLQTTSNTTVSWERDKHYG